MGHSGLMGKAMVGGGVRATKKPGCWCLPAYAWRPAIERGAHTGGANVHVALFKLLKEEETRGDMHGPHVLGSMHLGTPVCGSEHPLTGLAMG